MHGDGGRAPEAEQEQARDGGQERVGGLGRTLGDVLADGRARPTVRQSALFDGAGPRAEQLDDLLDALAASFPDDVTGTCRHEAGTPSLTRVRAAHPLDAEVWALTDVLRASIGADEALLLEQSALGTVVLAAPVGATGALGVLRRGGGFAPQDLHLLGALARMATR